LLLVPHICLVLADVGRRKEFEMDRVYLLIAGLLTGAALGLLSGNLGLWITIGVAMGVAMSVAARPRPKHPVEPQ
jgi:hypothetical protein